MDSKRHEDIFDAMPKQGIWNTEMYSSKTDTSLAALINTIIILLLIASPALLLALYRAVL